MDYPFDTETTSYAYATGVRTNYGFGHFNLYLRLACLARKYPLDSVDLTLRSQCSKEAEYGTEPFYAVRLLASTITEGLDVAQIPRLSKAITKLERGIAKLDAIVGAPATLLEEQMMRYLKVAGVEYLYVAPFDRSSGSITEWHLVNPKAEPERALSALRGLKAATLKAVTA